eukprot:TRINITY_DN17212_c0_g1_i1.p1 TRINITY_DN17212_c0_g1~~TRINITY_DN17212_c0_g1_i1.p1  ORF type:complete len:107 (-),score=12.25 TRINITY_DN17212_c0_g1_i1:43-363(-)
MAASWLTWSMLCMIAVASSDISPVVLDDCDEKSDESCAVNMIQKKALKQFGKGYVNSTHSDQDGCVGFNGHCRVSGECCRTHGDKVLTCKRPIHKCRPSGVRVSTR